MDAPLSSTDVKFLREGERPSLSSRFFYEPQSRYIANQNGSAIETGSPKIGVNIKILVCFICMGKQDRTLTDTNYHSQITMNQHKNWT